MYGDDINVSVTLSFDDYCTYYTEYTKKARWMVFIGLVLFTCVISMYQGDQAGLPPIFMIPPIAVMIIIGIMALFRPKAMNKLASKQYDAHKLLHLEQTYTINIDGVETVSSKGHNRYVWNDFYKHKELSTGFLLYFSQNQCFYIPKKCFTDAERDIPLLYEYLKAIPPVKKK